MNAKSFERDRFCGARVVWTWLRLAATGSALGLFSLSAVGAGSSGPPAKAEDLFQIDKVWTIHLRFTPEQWQAMEPAGADEPRRGPGRPGEFGPASFLAPAFLKGDQNHDGKLSLDEFRQLGESWFSAWDKQHRGELDLTDLRNGMNASWAMPPAAPSGPGARPGPPLQSADGHRNGLSGASGIDFQYVHADLEFEGRLLKDVGVRYKGNSTFMESRNSLKRSLKIELNKYVRGQKLAGVTKLNLHNNVTDASWMNEVLSYRLFRDAGVPASRTSYARVFVTVPGQYENKYLGLYSMVEEVDSHFAKDRFRTKEGAIFKPVTGDLLGYLGDDWPAYNHMYDPKTELSSREQSRVMDFSKLVTNASDAEFSARIADYLDLEEFARFLSVTVCLSTLDSILMMGQNFYVYLHPQTHQFQFLPWDLDHSFGQFPMGGTQEQREQLSIQKPWRGNNRFLERMFKVEAFKRLYLATLTQLSKNLFRPERISAQVDELASAIRPAVREESELKLTRFDKVVAGEPVEHLFQDGPGRDGPGRGRAGGERLGFGPGAVRQPPKPIKGFVVARAQSLADQLDGQSQGAAETQFEGPGGHPFGGRPGGPNGLGPGVMLARRIMEEMDSNQDGTLSHDEFIHGLARWFADWNTDHSEALSPDQLRAGINRALAPFHGGPPPEAEF